VTNNHISSLHSPHVERVKALLGPRGKKIRAVEKSFIADGIQSVREALQPRIELAPLVERLYLTDAGRERLIAGIDDQLLDSVEISMVTDEVMNAMADTESPQGIIALCTHKEMSAYKLSKLEPKKIAYFWEIQDPGNSGTVIRTADACGFDAVAFSPRSVDLYSPKTVRSTAGSLWHIPVFEDIELDEIIQLATDAGIDSYAFAGDGDTRLPAIAAAEKALLIFGNEARGLPDTPGATRTMIPMKGFTESLNVASAAAIAMYHFAGNI